jgi:non-canonical purine NTP pyrophosphatase (RdgB/HAM1 family)
MTMLQFVSSNPNKVHELKEILQIPIQMKSLDLVEIQTDDLTELVVHKARNAFQLSPNPLLVEDTSLYFEQWGTLPGPLIKWFIKSLSLEKLVGLLSQGESLSARAVCVLAFTSDGKKVHCFKGEVQGEIVSPRGNHGFGWDPIFQPIGSAKTFGEMNSTEKKNSRCENGLRSLSRSPQ